MSDAINKLQPHRTIHLQGFDDFGAAAAITGASDSGFAVSGVFRDTGDFAVLVLWEKDDQFAHAAFKYLPDDTFAGIVLEFDMVWAGIHPFESQKSPWVDWNAINAYTPGFASLSQKPYLSSTGITTTCNTTGRTGAFATFTIQVNNATSADAATIWYQNQAFGVAGGGYAPSYTASYSNSFGTGFVHNLAIGGTTYTYAQLVGDGSGDVANGIYAAASGNPYCDLTPSANTVICRLKASQAGPVAISSSDGSGSATLTQLTSGSAAAGIAALINAAGLSNPIALTATATSGGTRSGSQAYFNFFGTGYVHQIVIAGTTYSYTQLAGDGSGDVAIGVAAAAAADPNVTCVPSANLVVCALQAGVSGPIAITSNDGGGPLTLSVFGTVTVTAAPGTDGNTATLYVTKKGSGISITPTGSTTLTGGSSDSVSWHVKIDFSAAGWTNLQRLYLTFAPLLPYPNGMVGGDYIDTEWLVIFSNWTVTGAAKALKVAGPGSVRIEETDITWVKTTGFWEQAPGQAPGTGLAFWSEGRAIRAATIGVAGITVTTHCQHSHDVYLGTLLYNNCGIITAKIDGGSTVVMDLYQATGYPARRLLWAAVAAGAHVVTIEITGMNGSSFGSYFYFDFLECAVLSDVPAPLETLTGVGAAVDFDTDNAYKLSPQRLLWNLNRLGIQGEIDHYCGVFWWNQRKAVGKGLPVCTVTFGGTWHNNDVAWIDFNGGSTIGKTFFLGQDTTSTMAEHFANFINEVFVGIVASASGAVLTLTPRSYTSLWSFHIHAYHDLGNTGTGTVTQSGDLNSGFTPPTWQIDTTQTPVFNRAFRDWHADYMSAVHSSGLTAVASFSQELCFPPDDVGGGHVWIQRYGNGDPVATDTGFGVVKSSQIAFGSEPATYMGLAHAAMATIMVTAGLTPKLQFGEVLWWFTVNPNTGSGMAFYDADTVAAATAASITLHAFLTPNDSPIVSGGTVSADFLRTRLYNFMAGIMTAALAAEGSTLFELLWPMDVNDPDTAQLMRYVNLPTQFMTRSGSGLDTFMVEGFQYPGILHNLDKATRCAKYPYTELSWDKAHCRYLMGWYYDGWPWSRDYVNASRLGLALLKVWAYDHICLFNWPLPLPKVDSQSWMW